MDSQLGEMTKDNNAACGLASAAQFDTRSRTVRPLLFLKRCRRRKAPPARNSSTAGHRPCCPSVSPCSPQVVVSCRTMYLRALADRGVQQTKGSTGLRFFFEEAIMARQRGTVGAGVLLGLLVLAVVGRADEAAAVKAIEKLGGEVRRDEKVAGKPVIGVSLCRPQVTDADLQVLKELKRLRGLGLNTANVTDTGLKELKEIKTLELLALNSTKVTDAGLKELKQLKNLKELFLADTAVTDAGLKELKQLKSLRVLWLESTKVTDAGLKQLKELKSLRKLDLFDTKVTDAGVNEFKAALPKLEISR